MSGETLMFLRPPKDAHDAAAGAGKNEIIVKQKESCVKEVRVKEVVENINKEAQIGAESRRRL